MLSWPLTSSVYMILLIKLFPFFLIEKNWSEGLKDWPSNHFLCPLNNFLIWNSFAHTRSAVLVCCHIRSPTVLLYSHVLAFPFFTSFWKFQLSMLDFTTLAISSPDIQQQMRGFGLLPYCRGWLTVGAGELLTGGHGFRVLWKVSILGIPSFFDLVTHGY